MALTLEGIKDVIDEALKPIKEDLASINSRLDKLQAIQTNSRARLRDRLVKVPLPTGGEPANFPPTLGALILGGSELLSGGAAASWNMDQSLQLILQYDPAYQTENETSSSDGRKRKSSRRCRLHLAHLIGVTVSQMQMGLMEAVL